MSCATNWPCFDGASLGRGSAGPTPDRPAAHDQQINPRNPLNRERRPWSSTDEVLVMKRHKRGRDYAGQALWLPVRVARAAVRGRGMSSAGPPSAETTDRIGVQAHLVPLLCGGLTGSVEGTWTSDCSLHFDARTTFSAAAARSTSSVRSSTAVMKLVRHASGASRLYRHSAQTTNTSKVMISKDHAG